MFGNISHLFWKMSKMSTDFYAASIPCYKHIKKLTIDNPFYLYYQLLAVKSVY